MPMEKAEALVLRSTDWSESSSILTLWTRELGRVRALAKGARRPRSNFENALDLLSLCSIVFLRKSSDALDLLTEARVIRRFPGLTNHLLALYGGYYLAELLSEHTEDYDPHPELFDGAIQMLTSLSEQNAPPLESIMRFELLFLNNLGYRPALLNCTDCETALKPINDEKVAFSAEAGGALCSNCRDAYRDRRWASSEALQYFHELLQSESGTEHDRLVEAEARRILSQYMTWHLGRRPRLLPYLEQGS